MMKTFEITVGISYSSRRWKGDRKVTQIARHRGQPAVVHYIDLRTYRTGNALLPAFASSANGIAVASIQAAW